MDAVIKIDEDVFTRLFDNGREDYAIGVDDLFAIVKSIRNCTPLPKGHGDLIDVDCLREDFKTSKKISFAERMDISCIVDHAPIIVEADVEGSIIKE